MFTIYDLLLGLKDLAIGCYWDGQLVILMMLLFWLPHLLLGLGNLPKASCIMLCQQFLET